MPSLTRDEFVRVVKNAEGARAASGLGEGGEGGVGGVAVPVGLRLLADQLTPVLAYRRLVAADERTAPSFLFESVEGGGKVGRYSILSSSPAMEVVARGHRVTITNHATGESETHHEDDPLDVPRRLTKGITLARPTEGVRLPECLCGGWVGYVGYDSVRWAEPGKLGVGPEDDRDLPDLHMGFYDGVVVFDHVDKIVHVIGLAMVGPGGPGVGEGVVGEVYDGVLASLERRAEQLQRHSKPLASGRVDRDRGPTPMASNTTRQQHAAMVDRALEYIRAGDIFQVVVGQRFERRSRVDPFDVYRALRAVNPSPYMVYLQAAGCILVASSPEILCRVRGRDDGRFVVTNRPLAGTRRRGATPEEDLANERELLADKKERAEHVMLVDLGRNDVGKVAEPGSIELPSVMEIERYSHVMHISSTVTGVLRDGLDCWDALRAALPVGTISGAPKIRAMQIIDELEPVKRGPYGGGMGYVGLDGQMDIALTLRTMVAPTHGLTSDGPDDEGGRGWTYHIQAAGGIVADSRAEAEYEETVNKAAALGRAIDVAEGAFDSR